MILLTTPSARVAECAAAIHGGTSHKVQTAATLQEAIGLLREAEYPVVVLDQCMLDADPDQAEVALQHTGTALVVNVNCAIAGTERIVREVRTALRRRQREAGLCQRIASAGRIGRFGVPAGRERWPARRDCVQSCVSSRSSGARRRC